MVGGAHHARTHQQGRLQPNAQLEVPGGNYTALTLALTKFICLQTVTELVKDQISPKLLGWVAELSEENKKVLLCFETNILWCVGIKNIEDDFGAEGREAIPSPARNRRHQCGESE